MTEQRARDAMEQSLFDFLCRKYVQRADARQKSMGLQYTTAETSDLAREVARFVTALTPFAESAKSPSDSVREALERIDKFVIKFRSPWGAWKTAWWEGEVSDEAALTADNALMHIANIARAALQSSEADNG